MPAKRRRRTPAPEADTAIRFGARLRELRTEAKLSQAALGAPYFTRAHISAIELGKIPPALKSLAHFARALDVPLRELIPAESSGQTTRDEDRSLSHVLKSP